MAHRGLNSTSTNIELSFATLVVLFLMTRQAARNDQRLSNLQDRKDIGTLRETFQIPSSDCGGFFNCGSFEPLQHNNPTKKQAREGSFAPQNVRDV
jgi:hypothetical protein